MMGIWGLLCIGTSWLPAVAAVTPTSTTIEGDDGKDAPEKGDLQCPSLADRYNDYMLNGDATEWLTLCQGETTDNSVPDLVVPDNGIVLEFYASLPAFTDNLGTSNGRKQAVFPFSYQKSIHSNCYR